MTTRDATALPDGLTDDHARQPSKVAWHASLLSILILGAIVAAALLGLFGGGRARPVTVLAPAATLTVHTPRVLRSGLFFETRIVVEARRDLADAVLAMPPGLWLDQTINTQIPAAESESFKDGTFRFHYGSLKAGETLEVKIDGQINPPLFAGTSGRFDLFDGETPLASVPLKITVLP